MRGDCGWFLGVMVQEEESCGVEQGACRTSSIVRATRVFRCKLARDDSVFGSVRDLGEGQEDVRRIGAAHPVAESVDAMRVVVESFGSSCRVRSRSAKGRSVVMPLDN